MLLWCIFNVLSLLLSLFPPLLSPAPSLPLCPFSLSSFPSFPLSSLPPPPSLFVPSLSPPFPLSPSPLSRPLPPSLSLPCDFLEHLFHLHQVSWGTAPGQGEGGAGLDLCHGPTPSRIHKVSHTTPASCVFQAVCVCVRSREIVFPASPPPPPPPNLGLYCGSFLAIMS